MKKNLLACFWCLVFFVFVVDNILKINSEISSETQTGATESSTGATSSGQNTQPIQLIQEDEKSVCLRDICIQKTEPYVEKDGKLVQVQQIWYGEEENKSEYIKDWKFTIGEDGFLEAIDEKYEDVPDKYEIAILDRTKQSALSRRSEDGPYATGTGYTLFLKSFWFSRKMVLVVLDNIQHWVFLILYPIHRSLIQLRIFQNIQEKYRMETWNFS